MSPLAQNIATADPTLELISAGAAPTVPATDATLILSAFSPGTRRQLELTVNALSRTFRRAIRHAERLERDNAPFEEQDAAWKSVEHRSALLQDFLKSLALPAPLAAVLPPEPAPEPAVPASAPAALPQTASARPGLVPATSQLPRMDPATLPPVLATPSIVNKEDALFAEYLAETRRVRVMPDGTRADRRRKARLGEALIAKINRHGDDFANRMLEAMEQLAASDPIPQRPH